MSPSSLIAADQRASRYWFDDGLPTILVGTAYLLMSFFLLYPREGSSTFAAIAAFAAMAGFGILILRQRQILDWLKSRITYPRTGYAAPPPGADDAQSCGATLLSLRDAAQNQSEASRQLYAERTKHLGLIVSLTLVVFLLVLFFRNPWVCSVAGLLMSAAMWLAARREQQLTWFALAGFPIMGIALTLFLPLSITGPERVAWFIAGSGALFFLDGAFTLFRYLRANPQPHPTKQ
jgi:hypothetical protein